MQIVQPKNETEIVEAVRSAGLSDTTCEIISGGSKRTLGRATKADMVLDVSALSGIISYEPDELVLTVKAATPLSEMEAALSARRQMLAFSPTDWGAFLGTASGRATAAGIVASNSSGARRVKAGAVRDHLIGCRFVNGAGDAIKAGGKVVKNVTGFDLPKLMCGAFGTLGVLTELTFRVAPAPERAPTLVLRNCAVEAGLRALGKAASLPVEPAGLAYLPANMGGRNPVLRAAGLGNAGGLALICVEGTPVAAADKIAKLQQGFAGCDMLVLDDDISAPLFREIGNASLFVGYDNDVWRLCVPCSNAGDAVAMSGADVWYADWAGGALWLALPATSEIETRLRAITARFGGHATLMRASDEARARLHVFEPEGTRRASLTRTVKNAFDTKRLLNRGRMFEEI